MTYRGNSNIIISIVYFLNFCESHSKGVPNTPPSLMGEKNELYHYKKLKKWKKKLFLTSAHLRK